MFLPSAWSCCQSVQGLSKSPDDATTVEHLPWLPRRWRRPVDSFILSDRWIQEHTLTSAVWHVTPSDPREDAAASNRRVEVTIEVLAINSDSSTFSS